MLSTHSKKHRRLQAEASLIAIYDAHHNGKLGISALHKMLKKLAPFCPELTAKIESLSKEIAMKRAAYEAEYQILCLNQPDLIKTTLPAEKMVKKMLANAQILIKKEQAIHPLKSFFNLNKSLTDLKKSAKILEETATKFNSATTESEMATVIYNFIIKEKSINPAVHVSPPAA